MAVKIRLTRMGSKKKPYYRINALLHGWLTELNLQIQFATSFQKLV